MPAAEDIDTFADELVQMAEFNISESSPVADRTVQEADQYESLTFAAVLRNDSVVIPRGDAVLKPGDDVVVIGSPESVQTFAHELEPELDGARNVLIVGGSDVGYHTARLLRCLRPPARASPPSGTSVPALASSGPSAVIWSSPRPASCC
ncbi:hypothetical protein BRC96_05620 [Halobacteriales archaeon QS_6_64_34]|nr:MAG: hypothetical protein BRC96_05620 [Halobacteriales archaeon QS_6_64_34]